MDSSIRQKIEGGTLARLGLTDAARIGQAVRVVEEVERAGLETVRVLFADQHGILRGKAVVASAIASVFANGIAAPSTLLLKDTSNRTVFPIWQGPSETLPNSLGGAGDVLLNPDPLTFRILPWSDRSAWLLCDVHGRGGEDLTFAPRSVLQIGRAHV